MKKYLITVVWFILNLSFPGRVLAQIHPLPTIEIISPRDGQIILGTKITLSFIVGNFLFNDFQRKPTNNPDTPYEGHMHLWIDEEKPTRENAAEIISHEDKIIDNLGPGKHTLRLALAENDHQPFSPPLERIISFQTIMPAPSSLVPTPPVSATAAFFSQIPVDKLLAAGGLLLLVFGLILFSLRVKQKYY